MFPFNSLLLGANPGVEDAVLTIGKQTAIHSWWSTHSGTTVYDGWGYDGGADYHSYATNVGDLVPNQFYDGNLVLRTISSIIHSELQWMYFSLDGINIPDEDDTWVSVNINGTLYVRADATGYTASQNGGTHWWWAEPVRPYGQSGDVNITVNV